RSTSTLLNESRRWHHDAIERQFAHQGSDEIWAAYNSAQFWEKRVRMMQWRADQLYHLKRLCPIVPIRAHQRSAAQPHQRPWQKLAAGHSFHVLNILISFYDAKQRTDHEVQRAGTQAGAQLFTNKRLS